MGARALRVNATAEARRWRKECFAPSQCYPCFSHDAPRTLTLRIIRSMTGENSETDTEPKWLRPIDPFVAASLPIRIDPRLGVDDDIAHRLQRDAEPLLAMVTVFVTSNYDNVLAAEVANDAEHGLHVLVRAATGDEAAYLLRSDDEQDADRPESAGRDITWQQAEDSEFLTESAIVLWSGEVLLKTGSGLAGRFYTHQSAAAAWAFSTALGMARAEVFGVQLVRWLCARSKADLLLAGVDGEFQRLNRFWIAPIRTAAIFPIALPGQERESVEALTSLK